MLKTILSTASQTNSMLTSNRSMGANANGMAIKINHTIKLAAPPQKRIENEGSTAQQRQLFA